VRLTDFWERMESLFGPAYATSLAADYVFAQLGGRTIQQAFASGMGAAEVWRAVCASFEVPSGLR
jgi:hypothetical protein